VNGADEIVLIELQQPDDHFVWRFGVEFDVKRITRMLLPIAVQGRDVEGKNPIIRGRKPEACFLSIRIKHLHGVVFLGTIGRLVVNPERGGANCGGK
jgi:hypothetical protein